MRSLRSCGLLVLIGLCAVPVGGDTSRPRVKDKSTRDKAFKKADKSDKSSPGKIKEYPDLGDLHAEVTVLRVLHAFDTSPEQLKALARLAGKTAQQAPPRRAIRATEGYRKALRRLRAALVSDDAKKIDDALTTLDEVSEKDTPTFDEVELSDAARKAAPGLLRTLNARQVALYIAGLEDFPDPVERLVEAMEESRKVKGKEWQELRDDVAYQVGWLVGGVDSTQEEKARDRAEALLNKAQRLTDKGFAEQLPQLKKQARDLAGKLGPTDVIRHYVERVLAEVLSNHCLADAVEARLKNEKK